MTLEQYAYLAQIVGSLGVIVSLVFVGLELRKSTAQSKLGNYSDMINRFMTAYNQTNDPAMADIVVRGRQSYHTLSDADKLSFGYYMEQILVANESQLLYDDALVHRKGLSISLWAKHVRFHLGFPGARDWFEEFSVQRGFPETYMQAIRSVLGQEHTT